jgi:hypothetical protein
VNVVQTALIFIGIPLAIATVFAVAVYGRSEIHQPNRYRPGRPWSYPPVWYLPHASVLESQPDGGRQAIEGSPQPVITAEGGASGEW